MLGHHPTARELHRVRDAPGTLPESRWGPHFSTNADWLTSSSSRTPIFPGSVNDCAQSSSWNTPFVSHTHPPPASPTSRSLIGLQGPERLKHRRWVQSSLTSELVRSIQCLETTQSSGPPCSTWTAKDLSLNLHMHFCDKAGSWATTDSQ